MHTRIPLAAAASLMFATTAMADQAHFQHGFFNACFQSLPNFDYVRQELPSPEWQMTHGADSDEFEFYSSGTNIFLTLGDTQESCVVMDPSVSIAQAEKILEDALMWFLANNSPSSWDISFDHNNQVVRTLHVDELFPGTSPIKFYIAEGLGGGAAIITEINL